MNLNQVTLPAKDVLESADFYRRMGFTQIVEGDRYARFECPEGGATFSLHLVDEVVPETGVTIYFELEGLDEKVEELQAAGFVFTSQPEDMRWLWREARLRDPSGNEICLFRAGENRRHPPWRVN